MCQAGSALRTAKVERKEERGGRKDKWRKGGMKGLRDEGRKGGRDGAMKRMERGGKEEWREGGSRQKDKNKTKITNNL